MQQIIAMGGGGFSMEPDNLALDRYVLAQTGKTQPKVCFLSTASGDDVGYTFRFMDACLKLDARPSYLHLFRPPTGDLADFVLEKDVIYVGGGQTRNMLALWREWGLDAILRQAYDQGVVLAGISAGANCWFAQCSTDSLTPGQLGVMDCLGFLPGSFCPHYDGEPERRPTLHQFLRAGQIQPGYAADNSAALHFVDGQPLRAVCSRPEARVYRVDCADGQPVETALDMLYLSQQTG